MFSTPTQPSRLSTGSALVYWDVYPLSNVITTGFPGPSGTPRVQLARSWSIVTACHPADLSACICWANSSAGTYRPGNGAPAGGGLITWYIRIGTVALPGTPVPFAASVVGWLPVLGWECAVDACLPAEARSDPVVGLPPALAIAIPAALATTAASAPSASARLRWIRCRRARSRSARRASTSLKLICTQVNRVVRRGGPLR